MVCSQVDDADLRVCAGQPPVIAGQRCMRACACQLACLVGDGDLRVCAGQPPVIAGQRCMRARVCQLACLVGGELRVRSGALLRVGRAAGTFPAMHSHNACYVHTTQPQQRTLETALVSSQALVG